MADQSSGAGGVPAGIKRSELVLLPICGKTVEVQRWSYQRAMMVSSYLGEVLKDLPDDVVSNPNEAMKIFFERGSDRMFEVAKLSVAPQHRDLINEETDGSDVIFVIEKAFALNAAGDLLKKAMGLAGQFVLSKAVSSPMPETRKEPETASPK